MQTLKSLMIVALLMVATQLHAQIETGMRNIWGSGRIEHQAESHYNGGYYYFKNRGCFGIAPNLTIENVKVGLSDKKGYSVGTIIRPSFTTYWIKDPLVGQVLHREYNSALSIGRFMRRYHKISNKFAYFFQVAGSVTAQNTYFHSLEASTSHSNRYNIGLNADLGIGMIYRASDKFIFSASTNLINFYTGGGKSKGSPFKYDKTVLNANNVILNYFPTISVAYILKQKS